MLRKRHRDLLLVGTHQRPGVGIEVDASFKETYAALVGFQLINVYQAIVDAVRSLVGELVICRADGGKGRIVFLHMIHFGLQQARNHVVLDESVSGIVNGSE